MKKFSNHSKMRMLITVFFTLGLTFSGFAQTRTQFPLYQLIDGDPFLSDIEQGCFTRRVGGDRLNDYQREIHCQCIAAEIDDRDDIDIDSLKAFRIFYQRGGDELRRKELSDSYYLHQVEDFHILLSEGRFCSVDQAIERALYPGIIPANVPPAAHSARAIWRFCDNQNPYGNNLDPRKHEFTKFCNCMKKEAHMNLSRVALAYQAAIFANDTNTVNYLRPILQQSEAARLDEFGRGFENGTICKR